DPGPDSFFISSLGSLSLEDIFVLKLDVDGGFEWAKQIGSEETDIAYGIDTDPWGNVIFTGLIREATDFDPGPNSFLLTPPASVYPIPVLFPDAFVCKLDTDGNFSWASLMGGGQLDEGYGVVTDEEGSASLTGYFNGEAFFGGDTLTAANEWDADI